MSITTSTILLAEEHDATRAFLADNLTADGYRVLIAPDCPKALALLENRTVVLFVLTRVPQNLHCSTGSPTFGARD